MTKAGKKTVTNTGKPPRRSRHRPKYKENLGKAFTEEELAYLCAMYHRMRKIDIAMALGRSYGSIYTKAALLKKAGRFHHYRQLGKELEA